MMKKGEEEGNKGPVIGVNEPNLRGEVGRVKCWGYTAGAEKPKRASRVGKTGQGDVLSF